MNLQTLISPPLQQYLPLSSTTSYSQTLIGSISPPSALVYRRYQNRNNSVFCSISQVHNYGTVDYERRPILKWGSLYRRISLMGDPNLGPSTILDQWELEERKISKWEIRRVIKELRKFRRFKLALEVYDWMANQGERFRPSSSDTAIQLDLISKVYGISSAEEYFSSIPETSKDKRTYGALLNAYAQAKLKEKAEATFEKMRDKGYLSQTLPFNVMMTMYLNLKEYENVISMVEEMRGNEVPLDIYSYNIWITTCAAMEDIEKMEQAVEEMKLDSSINPNWTTYSTLATMYIKLGHFEKGETCLKDVEIRITGRDRTPYNYLVSLYGKIGKTEEVYRVWNLYKSSFPSIPNLGYHSMISSLVRLGDIKGAEEVYEEWLSVRSTYDPKICNIIMGWYIREGLLKKAEDIFENMREIGGKPNTNTWEILAEGYIAQEQISKALSCMKEASSFERAVKWRPKPDNVAALLALCEQEADTASMNMLIDLLKKVNCLDTEAYKSLFGTDIIGGRAVDGLELNIEKDEIGGDEETEVLFESP
eukprot:TRINITY_DN12929_c0_g1_i1.p1 TRINITY_DN12929_c0_g1~~TRINITY_DN12929_c0_g1_i1.p1  ORF type:complete len:537 (-),score=88.42 TRINITY_DN12929_c0_g1_i1:339-1949(-)